MRTVGSNLRESLRLEEWQSISRWFIPSVRVLEIGGGNGYQASLIAAHGCSVVSIDIAAAQSGPVYFPVLNYDGRHLPFQDEEFDVVFSSNVLEHVGNLPKLLNEIARVIKPKGTIIHVLPTPVWRFWTSVAHYPYLLSRLAGRKTAYDGPEHSIGSVIARRGWWSAILRILASPAHGEYPNAIAELWYFSRMHWLRIFAENGFFVVEDYPNQVLYTGYTIFPTLSIRARRVLSRLFGSSCRIFIMRKVVRQHEAGDTTR